MTTQEYLTESVKLCEKLGKFPEWEDGGCKCLFRRHVCGWAVDVVDPPFGTEEYFDASESHDHLTDHEAACIFEHHWRVWLEAKKVYLTGPSLWGRQIAAVKELAVKSKMEATP